MEKYCIKSQDDKVFLKTTNPKETKAKLFLKHFYSLLSSNYIIINRRHNSTDA